MADKRIIVYLEDNGLIRINGENALRTAFPDYEVAGFMLGKYLKDDLRKGNSLQRKREPFGSVGSEFTIHDFRLGDIAIIITDGELRRSSSEKDYGWDIVAELRQMGYDGPAIYTGSSDIPKDKRALFDAFYCAKGDIEGLVGKVKETLIY